jgi:hypothetical protein
MDDPHFARPNSHGADCAASWPFAGALAVMTISVTLAANSLRNISTFGALCGGGYIDRQTTVTPPYFASYYPRGNGRNSCRAARRGPRMMGARPYCVKPTGTCF